MPEIGVGTAAMYSFYLKLALVIENLVVCTADSVFA